jgi:hypothetical protein
MAIKHQKCLCIFAFLIADACQKAPDAKIVLRTYFRESRRPVPPEDPKAREILDLLSARFIRRNQTTRTDARI